MIVQIWLKLYWLHVIFLAVFRVIVLIGDVADVKLKLDLVPLISLIKIVHTIWHWQCASSVKALQLELNPLCAELAPCIILWYEISPFVFNKVNFQVIVEPLYPTCFEGNLYCNNLSQSTLVSIVLWIELALAKEVTCYWVNKIYDHEGIKWNAWLKLSDIYLWDCEIQFLVLFVIPCFWGNNNYWLFALVCFYYRSR